ncbi:MULTISPECIES: hypothetical protein [Pseudomonas]|uniref:Uncharacterized protein n=1 Tax=Pseudomonas wuhanensis TaxID=2954098 RepID=A0ABY9GQX5_9PSED|nr:MULTISPECIES: hypothetical protein [unclassified Pseudomonas]WLI11734.1 hypothetical protein PSH65_26955 [Pseudomonas sp. FP603]WLI17575.1 hypothetical protein PSH88_25590 [Pseudomonas sp. FP607]
MNIYYTGSNKNLSSTSDKLTAEIHNSFKFSTYDGTATLFITNGEWIILYTRHQISETEWNTISLRFPANIENKRYEFQPGDILPPTFSENWSVPDGSWHRPYTSKNNVGHITFNFDLKAGTLKADFNFTILNNEESHQAIGGIDVKGLEHITGQRHLEKLFE